MEQNNSSYIPTEVNKGSASFTLNIIHYEISNISYDLNRLNIVLLIKKGLIIWSNLPIHEYNRSVGSILF